MKSSVSVLLVTALAGITSAAKMQELMQLKLEHRDKQKALGAFDLDRYELQATTKCVNGFAGEYACKNVDMLAFLRHQDMGSKTREGNDIWGWTSSDGREFGAVGQTDGTAFVEVKADGSLVYIGRLPTQTSSSTWRDMKVIGDHVYIGSEASNHGLQVFDMKKLLNLNPSAPTTFNINSDLTAWYKGFTNSHNIVANPATNMIYAVGTSSRLTCKAGLWMLDVSDPANPTHVGCAGQDGYVHDAQCVVYSGPDTAYTGHEICFNFNEDTLTIVDVTNKASTVQLSRTAYSGNAYTHQGWLATDDMRYLLLDDELDEMNRAGPAADGHTTTRIFDITDLNKPVLTGVYKSPAISIDHNQYVVNGLSYQANYGSGLRIVNVSSVAKDPSGGSFTEMGFFDCNPEDDAVGGKAEFYGAWSVYPYFRSGYILLNSIERGVYSLKYTG